MTGLTSEFTDADDSTGLILWRVTNAWQAAQRATLKPFGLTHVQFVLLASLTWLGTSPLTQNELAQHAGTDRMMTSQVLRTLEKKGWVARTNHPGDGRAKLLAATAEGKALANAANIAVEACDALFFAPLDARQKFTSMLKQLS
jgi:DNA-binding MarR family transcriptional regulator